MTRPSVIRISLAITLLPAVHSASAQPISSTTCTTSADMPATVSAEGVAELMSDLVISCQGGTPTPIGQPISKLTLRLYVNTSATVRLFTTSPDLSEALLLVDEPAPQSQLVCPGSPRTIQGTGGGVGSEPNSPYNGSSGRFNVFQATVAAGNLVEWRDLPFDPPPPGRTRTLRITNIRADAQALATTQFPQAFGFVQMQGEPAPAVINPQQLLAYVQPGLRFTNTTAAFVSSIDHSSAPSTDFTITFSENFAGAFKPRTIASRPEDVSSNADQNVPGKTYPTASGFYNSSFRGSYEGAGLATQGTRLMAHFQNVPQGVSLYVTGQPVGGSGTLRVQLVSTGPKGDGPYYPIAAGSHGFAPITVYNGSAVAVWEVLLLESRGSRIGAVRRGCLFFR